MNETAAVPQQAGDKGGPALSDFKDWLSPMLVKELRQGLRTRVFVMAFILMQAAITVVMLAAAANGASGRETDALWYVTALVLLGAMPLRGFAALSNEMRMQTMDLLTLTRLTAFRITLGKWAALYSQSLLLAVALMPYVVIRYFLGGIDLVNDLVLLFLLTLASGVLTALTVGFSAHQSILLRGAVAVLAMIFASMVLGSFIEELMRGESVLAEEGIWWLGLALVAFAVFVGYFLLDMGASQFAPFAENHATRKRLAGLLFMVVLTVSAMFSDYPGYTERMFALMAISMTVVCVDALTERPAPVSSVYRPFVRRGLIGRLAGLVLYPGWHTGLIYFALVALLLFGFALGFDIRGVVANDNPIVALTLLGTILFPVVLQRLFFNRHPAPFALYLLIQCITVPLVLLLMSIDDGEGLLWIACPIPFVQFCINANSYQYSDLSVAVPFVFTSGYFVVLLAMSMNEHRKCRLLEREALAVLEAEAAEEAAAEARRLPEGGAAS